MSPAIDKLSKPKLWKDHIDRAGLEQFGAIIRKVYPKFETREYVNALVADGFDRLELKSRIALVARRLHDQFPHEYTRAVDVLIAVAPRCDGFYNWVLTSYVDQFGLDHMQASIRAMRELTKYGTAEFTVRPFIVKYPDQMFSVLNRWADDPNEHIRRLAAEGTRPRGVWTMHIEALRKDPRPALKILNKLKADESLYVRKAVANNLNDISKDHPDMVLRTALDWMKAGDPRTNWILKRACRSLIKSGHPQVFGLFGFTPIPKVTVGALELAPSRLRIGQNAVISVCLRSVGRKRQKLSIDYRVHYLTAQGRVSTKVFKFVECHLAPGESRSLSKRHSFENNSTRTHYPGAHLIQLVMNGKPVAECSVMLAA